MVLVLMRRVGAKTTEIAYLQQQPLVIGMGKQQIRFRVSVFIGFNHEAVLFVDVSHFFQPIQSRLYFVYSFCRLYDAPNTGKRGFCFPLARFYFKNFLIQLPEGGYSTQFFDGLYYGFVLFHNRKNIKTPSNRSLFENDKKLLSACE